jgi:hypothetical protein
MKKIIAILAVFIFAAGCIHTPAKVASEVPGVLKNASDQMNSITGPIEQNLTCFVMGNQTIAVEQTSAAIKEIKV